MHRSVNETESQNHSNSASYPVCKHSKGMCIAKPQVAAVKVLKSILTIHQVFKKKLASKLDYIYTQQKDMGPA